MTYSENYDLETSLEEAKSYLVEQYNSINTIKESVRDLMSSAGLVIALLSLLQININNFDLHKIDRKELLVLVAICFYILMIIISVFLLSPIKMSTPIEINKEIFRELFYNKKPKNILENRVTNYLISIQKKHIGPKESLILLKNRFHYIHSDYFYSVDLFFR